MKVLADCSRLLTEHEHLARPAAAKAPGLYATQFWWLFGESVPHDKHVLRFISEIRDVGIRLVYLNFAAGNLSAGERGIVACPDRRQEFIDSVDVAIGFGRATGVEGFNALYGNT